MMMVSIAFVYVPAATAYRPTDEGSFAPSGKSADQGASACPADKRGISFPPTFVLIPGRNGSIVIGPCRLKIGSGGLHYGIRQASPHTFGRILHSYGVMGCNDWRRCGSDIVDPPDQSDHRDCQDRADCGSGREFRGEIHNCLSLRKV